MTTKQNKGFTLLEILLVIAAIGILAAIVLVAINPNRQLAQVRDAQRRSDINTIYKALEQYLIDTGSYPSSVNNNFKEICNTGNKTTTDTLNPTTLCDNKADLRVLVPTYLAAIPSDPSGGGYRVAINENNRIAVYTVGENNQIISVNYNNILWTPSQITTALWLDGADASTITESGGAVSQWDYKSGNARNATQATPANQPTRTLNGLNGKTVLTFNGLNSFLGFSNLTINDNNTYIYSVYSRPTAGTHTLDIASDVFAGSSGRGYGNWCFNDNVLYTILRETSPASFGTHGSSTATGTFINGAVRTSSGTQTWRNGTALGTLQQTSGTFVTGPVLNQIGRVGTSSPNFLS